MDTGKFRRQNLVLLSGLAIQFILGMVLNLFVKIPDTHPGTSGNNYFVRIADSYGWGLAAAGGLVLMLHIIVGTGLLIGSFVLVIQALRSKYRPWILITVVGAIGILGAMFNGLSFLSYNRNLSSLIMAIGYLLATVSYTSSLVINHDLVTQRKIKV